MLFMIALHDIQYNMSQKGAHFYIVMIKGYLRFNDGPVGVHKKKQLGNTDIVYYNHSGVIKTH